MVDVGGESKKYKHHLMLLLTEFLAVREVLTNVLRKAQEDFCGDDRIPVVVVCGTGFIMPEARATIGISEPR